MCKAKQISLLVAVIEVDGYVVERLRCDHEKQKRKGDGVGRVAGDKKASNLP